MLCNIWNIFTLRYYSSSTGHLHFYLIILATVVDILIRTLFFTDDKIQTQTNSTTIRKLIVLHN